MSFKVVSVAGRGSLVSVCSLYYVNINNLWKEQFFFSSQNVLRIINIWNTFFKTCIYVTYKKKLLLIYYNYTFIRKPTGAK